MSALVVECFDASGVERLVIHCDVANAVSAAFARRIGFRFVGPAGRAYPDGSPRALLEFDLMRERYLRDLAPEFRERARHVRLETEVKP